MKKIIEKKKAISLLMAILLLFGNTIVQHTIVSKAATDYGLSNPRVEMQTRDVIEFGGYWQEEYNPISKTYLPWSGYEYTDSDGTKMICYNDKFYKKEPIKWQILSEIDTDGDGNTDEYLLMADNILDCQKYNEQQESVTWKDCTLRSWLNNDFYNTAFSDTEKKVIKENVLINEDFTYYDQARYASSTDFALAKGCGGWFWLRTPGASNESTTMVDGSIWGDYDVLTCKYGGSRPVLRVDKNSSVIVKALENREFKEVAQKKTTWDTVEFGSYNGLKITWKVLSVEGNIAFLVSDQALMYQRYNEEIEDVTWETSDIRKWLNKEFYTKAFTEKEQKKIIETKIKNDNNSRYKTDGGNDTIDNVFLLSLNDVNNKEYGFLESYNFSSKSRQVVPIDVEESRSWWLRSPGKDSGYAAVVSSDGRVSCSGGNIYYNCIGVCPAIYLDLSSDMWTKGNEITSDSIRKTMSGFQFIEDDNTSDESDSQNKQDNSTSTVLPHETSVAEKGENKNDANTNTVNQAYMKSNGVGEKSSASKPKTVKITSAKNKKSRKLSVKWKKLSDVSGYQLQYALNKKITKKKKSKITKKTSYTIKRLKKKKTYYVRVRAYKLNSSGKKVFGKWSEIKKVKIKK